MAKDVKPTRKNLMQIEDRIELSERGHVGSRSVQAEFRCTNSECWVSEY